jgi:LL-diaminopimelate aminotransferase
MCCMPTPAARLTRLETYPLAVLGARVQSMLAKGIPIIRLDIGSPDMPPAADVIETLADAACRADSHGYAGYKGIPAVRAAFATYYARRFGVALDPNTEVLPLLGSKEGIVNLCLAYLDEGDIALVPTIGYPSYSLGALLAGAEVFWMPVSEESGYLPDLDAIPEYALDRAKLLWVNYPNNPTGATVELAFYERAVAFCKRHDLLLASDNPYADVTFEGYRAPSALEAAGAKDCTVEFTSLSKTFNMAGWRIGAAVGNATALKTLLQVKSNMDSGHFIPIYEAAAQALETTTEEWIATRNHIYKRRRDAFVVAMPSIGLSGQTPRGSLYLWGRVPVGMTGADYCTQALEYAHVALVPGDAYGPDGTNYVRISIGMDDTHFDEAIERLKRWWASR